VLRRQLKNNNTISAFFVDGNGASQRVDVDGIALSEQQLCDTVGAGDSFSGSVLASLAAADVRFHKFFCSFRCCCCCCLFLFCCLFCVARSESKTLIHRIHNDSVKHDNRCRYSSLRGGSTISRWRHVSQHSTACDVAAIRQRWRSSTNSSTLANERNSCTTPLLCSLLSIVFII
jgi:hypothetical protein